MKAARRAAERMGGGLKDEGGGARACSSESSHWQMADGARARLSWQLAVGRGWRADAQAGHPHACSGLSASWFPPPAPPL